MRIRWREHEVLLVVMLFVILLGGYSWMLYQLPPAEITSRYEVPFTDHGVSFNLFRNIVWPDIAAGTLIFICYLYFHFYGIPRFAIKKKWGWLLLQILGSVLFVSAGLAMEAYFHDQWQYLYEGFSFFPKLGYHSNQQLDIVGIFLAALAGHILYLGYVAIRELTIRLIEKPDGKNVYRTLICNRVTMFMAVYTGVPFIAAAFHLAHNGQLIVWYYSFVIPVFLVYMTNTFWLFPAKGKNSFLSYYFLLRLLLSTFLGSLLSMFSPFNHQPVTVLLAFWAFQLLIVTPMTWLLYQQQKDKIVQLRGAQNELMKSTADLQFLRSQINPHFLFNTLNTIYGKALQENAEGTGEAIQRLGDMMRFMLHENTLDFIDMNKEINYLRNYIALQRLRIADSPDITIDSALDDRYCHHLIAPMLLIPFVENAFKHGIDPDRKSWINIRLDCNEREIHFTVSNSMHPPPKNDPEKGSGGIGNKNVLERLKLIYPGKHHVSVTGNGTLFEVKLTILT